MPLDSEGRVVLKIFDKHDNLLIARPCPSQSAAEEFWDKNKTDAWVRYETSAMVPRI